MADKNIMLSVVIITYNHEKFIEACINGVLIQKTNFPVEIIIGDDCSTDNNQAVITQIVARNTDSSKHIRLFLHDKSQSPQLPGKQNFLLQILSLRLHPVKKKAVQSVYLVS